MGDNYSDNQLKEMAAGMRKHPADERIVYASDEGRDIVLPMVQKDFVKAVIYAHPTPQAFAQETRAFLGNSMDAYKNMVGEGETLLMQEGTLCLARNQKPIPPDDLNAFSPLLLNAFSKISGVIDPHGDTQLIALFKQVNHKGQAPVPEMHIDEVLNVHLSGHTPLEFVSGGFTQEEKELFEDFDADFDRFVRSEWPDRIHKASPGDLVIFAGALPHSSSLTTKEHGQVNFLGMPHSGHWPEI